MSESEAITIDDFSKIEIKIGTIISAEEIDGSDKLIKLQVDFGEDTPRQVLSGIKAWFNPTDLVDQQAAFVTNLKPRQMMGLESEAMILASHIGDEAPVLLGPKSPTSPGAKIR